MIVTFLGDRGLDENTEERRFKKGADYFVFKIEAYLDYGESQPTYALVNEYGEITTCEVNHFVIKKGTLADMCLTQYEEKFVFEVECLRGIDTSYLPDRTKFLTLLKEQATKEGYQLDHLKGWRSVDAQSWINGEQLKVNINRDYGIHLDYEAVKEADLSWAEIAVGLQCGLFSDCVAIKYAVQAVLNGDETTEIIEIAGLAYDVSALPYLKSLIDWELVDYRKVNNRLLFLFLEMLYAQRHEYKDIENTLYQLYRDFNQSPIIFPIAFGGLRDHDGYSSVHSPIIELWKKYLEEYIWHYSNQVLEELEGILTANFTKDILTGNSNFKERRLKKFVVSDRFQEIKYSQTFMLGLSRILSSSQLGQTKVYPFKNESYKNKPLEYKYVKVLKKAFFFDDDGSRYASINDEMVYWFNELTEKNNRLKIKFIKFMIIFIIMVSALIMIEEFVDSLDSWVMLGVGILMWGLIVFLLFGLYLVIWEWGNSIWKFLKKKFRRFSQKRRGGQYDVDNDQGYDELL